MYSAEWAGEFEGYSKNFLSKHYWRVARTMGRDDAQQECVLVFLRCVSRYSGTAENGAHLMALYKRMLFEHWVGLSNSDTKARSEVSASHTTSDGEELPDYDMRAGETDVPVEVIQAIRRMPEDYRSVVSFLIYGPEPYASTVLDNISKGGPICISRAEADLRKFLGPKITPGILRKIREYFVPTRV